MDASAIELHETVIRLAKGIVTARERSAHVAGATDTRIATVLHPSPLAGLLQVPTKQLKAEIGVWENWLNLERAKA